MSAHAARAIRKKHKAESEIPDSSEISEVQIKALEEAFEAADKNGDGILSVEEYFDIFQTHGLSIDKEWVERAIARNDKDGDGGISFHEFMAMNRGRIRGESGTVASYSPSGYNKDSTNLAEKAKLAFNVYDRNHDGFLTKTEFRKTSKKMTDFQIEAVFDRFDKDRDGRLDFGEFKTLMESNKKN